MAPQSKPEGVSYLLTSGKLAFYVSLLSLSGIIYTGAQTFLTLKINQTNILAAQTSMSQKMDGLLTVVNNNRIALSEINTIKQHQDSTDSHFDRIDTHMNKLDIAVSNLELAQNMARSKP